MRGVEMNVDMRYAWSRWGWWSWWGQLSCGRSRGLSCRFDCGCSCCWFSRRRTCNNEKKETGTILV